MQTEAELARVVVEWLGADGWEVYQEVRVRAGWRADIVAKCGNTIWVVECKAGLTRRLVDQAGRWLTRAHRVSVAVRAPARPALELSAAEQVVVGLGVGVVWVGPSGVEVRFEPVDRPVLSSIVAALHPAQRDGLGAGSAGGGYHTPFNATAKRVRSYVEAHPGCDVAAVVAEVEHHYRRAATARRCLLRGCRDGIVRGVAVRDGRLYPAERA